MIKAIETRYSGYLFRSRTEARWAVFLDTLHIRYDYEKEGFSFDGVGYLPDFWLPDYSCWLEIKGTHYNPDQPILGMDTPEDWDLCRQLADHTECPVWMLFGEFCPLQMVGERCEVRGSNRGWEPGKEDFHDGCCTWGECPFCGKIGLGFFGQHYDCEHSPSVCDWYKIREARPEEENYFVEGKKAFVATWQPAFAPALLRAYGAARSARFEHGQCGPC